MPFATQAQMADGQEELVVKKVARRLMIEDYDSSNFMSYHNELNSFWRK